MLNRIYQLGHGRAAAAFAAAVFAAAAFLAPVAPAAPAVASGELPAAGVGPIDGAEIIGERWLTDRTLQLTIATDAFTVPAPVEITFPIGYSSDRARGWPVTYFTHGTNADEARFRTAYNGEALTASYASIVVAPNGDSGYWSDWFNNGTGGPPKYETFVMKQLIPLIDSTFNTIPDSAHRAIMGESMGGYGALMLASRHPDKFTAVASLSGAPDSNWPAGMAVLTASPALQGAAPDSIYGPRATHEILWRGHNPTDLAANLRGLDIQIFNGNGVLNSSYENVGPTESACAIEAGIVRPENVSFHDKLTSLNIPHFWQDESWGCHSPGQIQYQLAQAIDHLGTLFDGATSTPTAFDYASIESSFSIYGWHFMTDGRRAKEFLTLSDVSANGLTITGSGTTTITTPPLFNGAKPVTVSINGMATSVLPDKNGTITFSVSQGQPNIQQQYTLGAITRFTTTAVNFSR